MIKIVFYLGLSVMSSIGALFDPLIGVFAALGFYLLNPPALLPDDFGFRFQLWATIALAVGWLIHRRKLPPRVGGESRVLILLWCYIAVACLSCLWALVSAEQAWDSVFEMVKTAVTVTILVRIIESEQQFAKVVLVCILGVWHAAFMHTFGTQMGYAPPSLARSIGVLPDPQAAVMVLFVPTILLLGVFGTRIERVISWMALPFVLNSIVSSYERTGFLALMVEMLLLVILLPRRIIFRLLPFAALGAALFILRLAPPDYWEKMSTIEHPTEEASANSRFVINEASVHMLWDHPFGVGYRNYPFVSARYLDPQFLDQGYRSAHNSYFTVACETGVEGFVLWAATFGGTLWLLFRTRRWDRSTDSLSRVQIHAMGLELGLYGWLIGGWTLAYHEVDPAYWFIGFAVVLTRLRAQELAGSEVQPPERVEAVS